MENNKRLITLLNECAVACRHCASECLSEEDVRKMENCIRACLSCSDMCQTTINSILIRPKELDVLLQACQHMCRSCADECANHDMQHCKECEEACRKCAIECEDAHADLVK
jgi:hypothetical protein